MQKASVSYVCWSWLSHPGGHSLKVHSLWILSTLWGFKLLQKFAGWQSTVVTSSFAMPACREPQNNSLFMLPPSLSFVYCLPNVLARHPLMRGNKYAINNKTKMMKSAQFFFHNIFLYNYLPVHVHQPAGNPSKVYRDPMKTGISPPALGITGNRFVRSSFFSLRTLDAVYWLDGHFGSANSGSDKQKSDYKAEEFSTLEED